MHHSYLFGPHFFIACYLPVPDTTISYLAVSYSSSTSDCFSRPNLSQKQSAGSLPSSLCQRHFWDHFGDVATSQDEFNTLVLSILGKLVTISENAARYKNIPQHNTFCMDGSTSTNSTINLNLLGQDLFLFCPVYYVSYGSTGPEMSWILVLIWDFLVAVPDSDSSPP